jgi:FkbM family methyltransferase
VDVVLDVGANRGQYAEDLRRLGYADAIRSFEPVASAFEELSRRAAADPLWDVTNSALGREPGSAEINVAANGAASSSLLPMLDRHRAAAPEANYQSRESIRVEVLDDAAADLAGSRKSFLKVDTQGFEMAVLDGASGLLEEAIVAVQLELSLVPLYDGAPLYDEMLAYMSARGFRLCWVDPGFHDPDTHELLQFDGCFVKAAAAPPGA